ncbi:hypothetical protein BGX34_010693, partial [Mortierella sp. NVP85]
KSFQAIITSIAWSTRPDRNYLVTGCWDGSVLKWEVVQEEGEYRIRLCWGVTNGLLTVTDASMQDVRGLSRLNTQLLKQRGAIGEPQDLLQEAGKKVATMASVVSELKKPSSKVVQEPSDNTILRHDFGNLSSWTSWINKSVQEPER